jgi:hypothetical protein
MQRVFQEKQSIPELGCFEANNQVPLKQVLQSTRQVPSLKVKGPVTPHQEYIKPRDQNQVHSSLSEANMLTLIEKLVDIQQGAGQVLKALVNTRRAPAVLDSDVKNTVSTFAGDYTPAQAEA